MQIYAGTKDFLMPGTCVVPFAVTSIGRLVFNTGFYLLKHTAFLENPSSQNPNLWNRQRDCNYYFHCKRIFILLGHIVLDCELLRGIRDFFHLENSPTFLECICCFEKNVQILHQKVILPSLTCNPSPSLWTLLIFSCVRQLRQLRNSFGCRFI